MAVRAEASSRAFVALHLENGHRDWRWKLGADVRTRAALLGDQVVFASHEAVIYALRRGGGNLSWRATLPSRPLGAPSNSATSAIFQAMP